MRYKIHNEPFYEYEALHILGKIINGKSIQQERDQIIEKRGSKFKSAITPLFKEAIELEKFVKKNIQFAIPGFESTGQTMAEFLFKESSPERILAQLIFAHDQLLLSNIDNKELAILTTLDFNVIEKHFETESPPAIATSNFFSILDKCQLSNDEKLDVLRLYHNLDEYRNYTNALLAQVKGLICKFIPDTDEDITTILKDITGMLETNGSDFLEEFNISFDDKHALMIYPGIYRVNSCDIWGMGFADYYNMCVGKHCLTVTQMFKEAKSNEKESEAFLKCLSDNTKFSILKLLKNGPMYGGQLAEILECTSANISHHASALLGLGIVRMEKESNRIYLHLDKEKIIQHIDDLKGLF